jgi:site-specific recombinase XerD
MALNLYRKHNGRCSQKRPPRLHTRKAQESPRYGWKKCECPIYASGTLADGFKRKNTGCWEWRDAERNAAAWEAAGRWSASAPPFEPDLGQKPEVGVTIEEATEAFVLRCQSRQIRPSTLGKYRTLAKQLRTFCESRGYVRLRQVGVTDMDHFYQSWKDGIRARGKKLERLRAFVKFCLKRKWLTEDIIEDLQSPVGSSTPGDRMPFSDEELEQICRACEALPAVRWKNDLGQGMWSGKDVEDFIFVSTYTGLRISDVAMFDMESRLGDGNQILLRMHKTGKPVFTWIPDWLMERLKLRQQTLGNRIFAIGRSTRLETITDLWRRKIQRVLEVAEGSGQFSQRPVPHRFRHTFCRVLLQRGVPVKDVAELIGDTEEMVRKHYAKWVPERQERLTQILRSAFEDRPRSVAIDSRKMLERVS